MNFKNKVEVLGYDPLTVTTTGLCVKALIPQDNGSVAELVMYPEESKRLRKALKRAERAQRLSV